MNNTDHIELLCDMGELDWVFSDTSSVASFLDKTVKMVARHMQAAVCSIYLLERGSDSLVLRATFGLNKEFINSLRLQTGEGITGLAVKEMRTISERIGSQHPNFKNFEGLAEEQYEAFLVTPLLRGIKRIGALVVQRSKSLPFSDHDEAAMRAVASQLANIIDNARELIEIDSPAYQLDQKLSKEDLRQLRFIRGTSGSVGFAAGKVVPLAAMHDVKSLRIRYGELELTEQLLQEGIAKVEHVLHELQSSVEEKLSDVASLIFSSHLLLLRDSHFSGAMLEKIRENGSNRSTAHIILDVAEAIIASFQRSGNEYFREKQHDILDLSRRILEAIYTGQKHEYTLKGKIVVAAMVLPSDMLVYSTERVSGVVLTSSGMTSHVAILSRSLGIPLITVDEPRLLRLNSDNRVLLDGYQGYVFVDPDEQISHGYLHKIEQTAIAQNEFKPQTKTNCGRPVQLMINVNLISDMFNPIAKHAAGIGLYRTEFPFIVRNTFPSEEEQLAVYKKIVNRCGKRPVTFRTLDIGGDKILPYYDSFKEDNPFLGLRSIRFSLQNPDIFTQQIKAILRASVNTASKILFPMVSSLEQWRQAKELVQQSHLSLKDKSIPCREKVPLGIMIELPAIVSTIDEFCQEVDFFSLGTNDFIQYTLAVDRGNAKVSGLYLPQHPAVIRSIATIARACARYKKPLSVCGDMAHDPRFIPFFLGIGVCELSAEVGYLSRMQQVVMACDVMDCATHAQQLISCTTTQQANECIGEFMKRIESRCNID